MGVFEGLQSFIIWDDKKDLYDSGLIYFLKFNVVYIIFLVSTKTKIIVCIARFDEYTRIKLEECQHKFAACALYTANSF